MITPQQSRAARGFLNWTQEDLAQASGISKVSIVQFERGQSDLKSNTSRAIEAAFRQADIEFPDAFGLRLRQDNVQILKGTDALKLLWDDIFHALRDGGGEVLITNVDEKRTLEVEPQALMDHLKRLKDNGISERLLSCEGDSCFLMPKEYYRWISKELFTFGTSTYLYADRVAFQMWRESIIVLIQSPDAFEAEKRRFEQLWANATIPY